MKCEEESRAEHLSPIIITARLQLFPSVHVMSLACKKILIFTTCGASCITLVNFSEITVVHYRIACLAVIVITACALMRGRRLIGS